MDDTEISIFPARMTVYATFWQRLLAFLLDLLILSIPDAIIRKVAGGEYIIRQLLDGELTYACINGTILSIIIGWLYFALMESSRAQATVGKQALGLQVTNLTDERISFGKATVRNFAKWISELVLFIGYLMPLWTERKQALHDEIAGTLVVKKQAKY